RLLTEEKERVRNKQSQRRFSRLLPNHEFGNLLDRAVATSYSDMSPRGRPGMKQFKRIEWNLQKIHAHGLSAEEVETAFDRVFSLQERNDGSFQMFAATPRVAAFGG